MRLLKVNNQRQRLREGGHRRVAGLNFFVPVADPVCQLSGGGEGAAVRWRGHRWPVGEVVVVFPLVHCPTFGSQEKRSGGSPSTHSTRSTWTSRLLLSPPFPSKFQNCAFQTVLEQKSSQKVCSVISYQSDASLCGFV